jgi:transporter family protein
MSVSYFYSLLALIVWGLWGVFSKVSTGYISPNSAAIYEIIGIGIIVTGMLIYSKFHIDTEPHGIFYAILTGMCVSLGALFFLIALSKGDSRTVTVTTSLYPLVTLVCLFAMYREPVSIFQAMGMILALCAMVLFAF